MSKNLLNRYIWIIDTIRRHGRIKRDDLNRLWQLSDVSGGDPLPRRTFYNYRGAIADLFKIHIECSPSTFEYYIDDEADENSASVTDWLLNTASLSNVLADAREVSDRVFLEDVPSARQFLSPIITAIKERRTVRFHYSPYSRTGAPKPVTVEPFFLKIFKLRWYLTGRNVREGVIKTYALDRMTSLTLTDATFTEPPGFSAEDYFRDSFGIVFSQGRTYKVTLRVTPRQAKYFRALPLHHSQTEMICDTYSLFNYRLRLTPDFVQELLSYGPNVTVIAPAELRAMITTNLRQSLQNYAN